MSPQETGSSTRTGDYRIWIRHFTDPGPDHPHFHFRNITTSIRVQIRLGSGSYPRSRSGSTNVARQMGSAMDPDLDPRNCGSNTGSSSFSLQKCEKIDPCPDPRKSGSTSDLDPNLHRIWFRARSADPQNRIRWYWYQIR